jgi:LuxR family maltose regulon positive regulatory protein
MAMPLLVTKLYIPPLRSGLVSRPRLVERLDEGLRAGHKLTLVSGPAGFGKTTLLSEWTAGCAQDTCIAWVSLDQGDNDLAQFLAYLVAAIQAGDADLGAGAWAMLRSPQPPSAERVLTALINDLAARERPVVLVLDDGHEITAEPVHDALVYLLDHLSPQMHVMMATRVDPPWPLGRLRARREMTEIRAGDLRFSPEETAHFLMDVMGLGLSAEHVAALNRRTEGWIAGLQMAALSMRGQDAARTQAFIQAFGGSHRFILDYLVEEVLDRQADDIRAFLLRTSILERLTAPLCDALMDDGGVNSQAVLTHLERANLFLVPLDDERRWYRYHALFADLLASRLLQRDPDQVPLLHRRAGEWYEAQGLIADAVAHALMAQDIEQIEHLVARSALAVIYRGGLAAVTSWLDALPEETVRSRPWLCIAYAWTLAYSGQHKAIEPLLKQVEQILKRGHERKAGEIQRLQGHIAAVRAYVVCFEQDMPRAIVLVREARDHLSRGESMERAFCALLLGKLLRYNGDLAEASQALGEAIGISREIGDGHLAVDVLCELVRLQLLQGQLRGAAATCRRALQLADEWARQGGQQPFAVGGVCAFLSAILYEWNDLDAAKRVALEGLELGQRWGQADSLADCYFNLATVLQAVGDADLSLEMIQVARPVARGLSQWFADWLDACEARIKLYQGDVLGATCWADTSGMSADDAFSFHYIFAYLTLARVLHAQGKLDDCSRLLASIIDRAEQAGASKYVILGLGLKAVVHREKGEMDQAEVALTQALTLAEPHGYVRAFIDEGEPMGELLQGAVVRGVMVDYVGRLLAELTKESTVRPSAGERPTQPLIEPLSERELQVLRLLKTPLSQPDIAQELYVSVNTVRTHVKHIYEKLNVHSRIEAIERAEQLGLE